MLAPSFWLSANAIGSFPASYRPTVRINSKHRPLDVRDHKTFHRAGAPDGSGKCRDKTHLSVVGAFMAVMPWNFVQSFRLSGFCFVKDDDIFRCQVHPNTPGRLLHPTQVAFPGLDDVDDDADVEADCEEMLFVEECAELFDLV
jgi:hypothetical protein